MAFTVIIPARLASTRLPFGIITAPGYRHHPAVLAQSAADVLDEVVALFDQALSGKFSAAENRMREQLADRAKTGEDRQALLDDLLSILIDPQIPDEDVGGLIRGGSIGLERLRAAIAQAQPRLPRDHGHLAALDSSYSYLRKFTPAVLSAVRFSGGTAATELLIAVDMLRELNATGRRKDAVARVWLKPGSGKMRPAALPRGERPAGSLDSPAIFAISRPRPAPGFFAAIRRAQARGAG